jgi:AcrR family transcriptional regulator
MPRIFDSGSRADLQAWKIAMLLAEEGAKALTIRRISDVCRLSTSSLMNHWGNKERLLRVAMFRNTR